jgi:hypothetical protein
LLFQPVSCGLSIGIPVARLQNWIPDPREGAIIFGDVVGKLDGLNVECERSARDRLIERYGIDEKLFARSDEITADCPRKQAKNLNDISGARCPPCRKRAPRSHSRRLFPLPVDAV